MSQAEIVGYVVAALVTITGLYATVGKPLIAFNNSVTKLNCTMEELRDKLLNLESHNTESHARLYKRIEVTEDTLNDHEMRIHDLERERED